MPHLDCPFAIAVNPIFAIGVILIVAAPLALAVSLIFAVGLILIVAEPVALTTYFFISDPNIRSKKSPVMAVPFGDDQDHAKGYGKVKRLGQRL